MTARRATSLMAFLAFTLITLVSTAAYAQGNYPNVNHLFAANARIAPGGHFDVVIPDGTTLIITDVQWLGLL